MLNTLTLLAQTTAPTTAPAPPPGNAFGGMLLPILLAIIVFWWIMSRGQRRERQKYAQMLAALKRNDRVQTIGGILGTVVDVRDDEVVLKVDESNNVKMRFTRSAIKEVFREPASGETK